MLRQTTVKRHNSWHTMLLKGSFVLISISLLSSIKAGTQATFYVSPEGNDANPGTLSAPFQTITAARDAVRVISGSMSGDIIVYLRGGDYRVTSTITFKSQDSGKNGYRIYYMAYPGEKPVLNGAEKVTGWTQYSGNIYKTTLNRSTKLRNLYVNDQRASMTSKTVNSKGGQGTYSVTTGQSWAWVSGSQSDGAKYGASDVPNIANNKDDLEIVNGTLFNENIVCVRDVVTTADNNRALLFQEPYGAIAQIPGWGAGFSVNGSHQIFNAFEFLNSPGQFYFDKTAKTLYYYQRQGENMATADVEVPMVEKLIDISGTSPTSRVQGITFQGITFANTDYNLLNIGGSYGKATVQGATVFIAFGDGNWHNSQYQIIDVLPAMITVNNGDSIDFVGNIIKHSGNDGISMPNDVINCNIIGNLITDCASSGITVGHPQHVYIGDGGAHAKYPTGMEGICKNITINNNLIYNISMVPGFGGCSGITAFFVEALKITYNHIETTAYNAISLGWGWVNFTNSTTCKNNICNNNRFVNIMRRLRDSGAIYTLGQQPGTHLDTNYVRGIPSGTTYGLHIDEGCAYMTINDNVLNVDPNVHYTINCEDFGGKHDLTVLRTYATVNKMGANPPNSKIDPPVVVSDNVWAVAQYNICVKSGVQDAYMSIIPRSVIPIADWVFPASCAATAGTTIKIRSTGDSTNTVWFAPSGTTNFSEGSSMTKTAGTTTSITAPRENRAYKLYVVNSLGQKVGESTFLLRITGGSDVKQSAEIHTIGSVFKTVVSQGKIIIGRQGDPVKYNVSVFMPNGRLMVKVNDNIAGVLTVPVKARGIYLVHIDYNGLTKKNVVSYY